MNTTIMVQANISPYLPKSPPPLKSFGQQKVTLYKDIAEFLKKLNTPIQQLQFDSYQVVFTFFMEIVILKDVCLVSYFQDILGNDGNVSLRKMWEFEERDCW